VTVPQLKIKNFRPFHDNPAFSIFMSFQKRNKKKRASVWEQENPLFSLLRVSEIDQRCWMHVSLFSERAKSHKATSTIFWNGSRFSASERPCERMRLTPSGFAGGTKQTKWKSGMPMCVGLNRTARPSALSHLFHKGKRQGIFSLTGVNVLSFWGLSIYCCSAQRHIWFESS